MMHESDIKIYNGMVPESTLAHASISLELHIKAKWFPARCSDSPYGLDVLHVWNSSTLRRVQHTRLPQRRGRATELLLLPLGGLENQLKIRVLSLFVPCCSMFNSPASFFSKHIWLWRFCKYQEYIAYCHEPVCCLGYWSEPSDSQLCSYVSRWMLICVSERVRDVLWQDVI